MDSPGSVGRLEAPSLRPSASVSSRISAIDVGQLDKINAIPNKSTNNVLLDGLSKEDQLYLDSLMDDESSSDPDSNYDNSGSPWSPPMAERPMTLSMSGQKRLKMRLKPQYAITLSLEDISYIRPSWGMSKGSIKRVSNKRLPGGGKNQAVKIDELEQKPIGGGNDDDAVGAGKRKRLMNPYHLFLALLLVVVVVLMVLSYLVELGRQRERTRQYRIELRPHERVFQMFKQTGDDLALTRALRVHYGRGIPGNLKHEDCTCRMFAAEARRWHPMGMAEGAADDDGTTEPAGECFTCLDWARRANLQLLVHRSRYSNLMNHQQAAMLEEDLAITCVDVRWQSYDALATPLVDCFELAPEEQWFGLGDLQAARWPLNKLEQDQFIPLTANLSAEFNGGGKFAFAGLPPAGQLELGAQVEFSLLSSGGFFIGNLRTDLQPAVRISASKREICLTAACADTCGPLWARRDSQAERLRWRNNLLEYSICSASSWRLLSLRLIDARTQKLLLASREANKKRSYNASGAEQPVVVNKNLQQLGPNQGDKRAGAHQSASENELPTTSTPSPTVEPIGLLERTIFKTSAEFLSSLDGQTVRQHVDKIVRLNLKTSPILLLDTRWQTHAGSFKLNAALFPKAKLLFEILHNKGFKILLTVKPYIEADAVGLATLRQLLEHQRLVSLHYESELLAAAEPTRHRMIPVESRNHYYLAASGASAGEATFERQTLALGGTPTIGGNATLEHMTTATVLRRRSFFKFVNETVIFRHELERRLPSTTRKPYLFHCKESRSGQCVLVDLTASANRVWLIDLMKRSSLLSQEADGLHLAGAHPESRTWTTHHRQAWAQLAEELFHNERLLVLPQWSGNFNYVQLAPRARTWLALSSTLDSVLALGLQGFALIHPGSVWGDLATGVGEAAHSYSAAETSPRPTISRADEKEAEAAAAADEAELAIRWLQLAVFLPILQFNDLAPIERHQLQEQLEALMRIRRASVVPELKKALPYTPLLHRDFAEFRANRPAYQQQLAALRYTWNNNPIPGSTTGASTADQQQQQQQQQQQPITGGNIVGEAVGQQFMIGAELLVAPVLALGQRQKDIYLPAGIWHDELRQLNIRGGKWLRNYPIELNEVAWFTSARR